MAIVRERPRQTVKEHWSDPASTREYAITDAPTRDIALAAVQSVIPAFDVVSGRSRFYESTDLKEFGGGCWDATVHYGKNPNTIEMNFDIGAGTVKAVVSKATTGYYDCQPSAPQGLNELGVDFPDFKRGVGWNGTSFDGVDVETPRMEFSVNKKLRASTLNANYLTQLFAMAQTVNDADWSIAWKGQVLTFLRGTLRFRGARIRQDSDDNLDVTYNFVYSRGTWESDNIRIGDSDVIEKLGHEYLWVYFEEGTEAGRKVKLPIAAYIEKVYEYSNFDFLLL